MKYTSKDIAEIKNNNNNMPPITEKQNREINNLHDLLHLGIELHKNTTLPKGFIVTVTCTKEQRSNIYKDILETTDLLPTLNETNNPNSKGKGFYKFEIVGITFIVY